MPNFREGGRTKALVFTLGKEVEGDSSPGYCALEYGYLLSKKRSKIFG